MTCFAELRAQPDVDPQSIHGRRELLRILKPDDAAAQLAVFPGDLALPVNDCWRAHQPSLREHMREALVAREIHECRTGSESVVLLRGVEVANIANGRSIHAGDGVVALAHHQQGDRAGSLSY